MTKSGSSRSCSKTAAATLSCSPTEKRAGTLYSPPLLTSFDLVTLPGAGLLPSSLIRVFAQHGGGRLEHRHDCDGSIRVRSCQGGGPAVRSFMDGSGLCVKLRRCTASGSPTRHSSPPTVHGSAPRSPIGRAGVGGGPICGCSLSRT